MWNFFVMTVILITVKSVVGSLPAGNSVEGGHNENFQSNDHSTENSKSDNMASMATYEIFSTSLSLTSDSNSAVNMATSGLSCDRDDQLFMEIKELKESVNNLVELQKAVICRLDVIEQSLKGPGQSSSGYVDDVLGRSSKGSDSEKLENWLGDKNQNVSGTPIRSCSMAQALMPWKRGKSVKQVIHPWGKNHPDHDYNNNTVTTPGVEVLCDFDTEGGGWTIIQRRQPNGQISFNRDRLDYENGFGFESNFLDGNFWLGLKIMRNLTLRGDQELRVELTDWDDHTQYAKYSSFSLSNETDAYRLYIDGYSGDAGDSMVFNNNMQFAAGRGQGESRGSGQRPLSPPTHYDYVGSIYSSGWWLGGGVNANLNGLYKDRHYISKSREGIIWGKISFSRSLKMTQMKIRDRRLTL